MDRVIFMQRPESRVSNRLGGINGLKWNGQCQTFNNNFDLFSWTTSVYGQTCSIKGSHVAHEIGDAAGDS